MNWEKSIYSEVNYNFVSNPFPKLGDNIGIKICFLKDESIEDVILRTIINGEETHYKMGFVYEKSGLVYFETEIILNQENINYHFIIRHKKKGIIYYNRKSTYLYPPTEDNDFVILADFENPDWVASSVFYQIFPDRFNKGNAENSVKTGEYEFDGHKTVQMKWEDEPLEYKDGHCLDFFGGDLKGIEDKIEYFKELGITALYLNPIFEAKTHHRYDCTDYFHVEKHLGGDEGLISLSDSLHRNNMKIMIDVSINHTGSNHVWMKKALENRNSEERSYYYFDENNNYKGWLGVHTLPQLNYNSEALKDIIYKKEDSLVKHYLKKPFNIDSWRFDVGCHMGRADKDQLGNELWKEIRNSIKSVKKDAYIIGEHWEDNISYLLGDQWDGAMNYFASGTPLRSFAGLVHRRLWKYYGKEALITPCSGKELEEQIMQHYTRIPNQLSYLQFNLIDSHDIFRFHSHEKAYDFDLYRGIISTMYMLPGTPNIYYGDEIGLNGHLKSDEGIRYPMVWDKAKWDMNHFEMYKKLSHLKVSQEILHYGNYKVLYTDEDSFVFSRYDENKFIVSILTRNKNKVINIPTFIIGLNQGCGIEIFDGRKANINNGFLTIKTKEIRNTIITFFI